MCRNVNDSHLHKVETHGGKMESWFVTRVEARYAGGDDVKHGDFVFSVGARKMEVSDGDGASIMTGASDGSRH